MRVGSILLSQDDKYLIDGRLPHRPDWDKDWLKYLCDCAEGIIYSSSTAKDLPKWAKKPLSIWDLNLGISTFKDAAPDLLFVVRSEEIGKGKQFDLSEWEKVEVEVYRRKKCK